MNKEQTKTEKTVRDYRMDLLITQDDLAERAGIAPETVKRSEASNKWPARPLTRRKYFKGLGLTRSKINAIEYSIASHGN